MKDAKIYLSNEPYQSLNKDQWINNRFMLTLSLVNFNYLAKAGLKSKR